MICSEEELVLVRKIGNRLKYIDPNGAQIATREALAAYSNPYLLPIHSLLHSTYIRKRNVVYLIAMECIKFINDSPDELQRRWSAESEALGLPVLAFNSVVNYAASQSFAVFKELYGFASRKELYHSHLTDLLLKGENRTAVHLLAVLQVDGEDYLDTVLFSGMFIDYEFRSAFQWYLKLNMNLAERLHIVLNTLLGDTSLCHEHIAKHGLLNISSDRINPEYIFQQIRWLEKNVLRNWRDRGQSLVRIKKLCNLRQTGNIQTKAFHKSLVEQMNGDENLKGYLIRTLLFGRLTRDAQAMVKELNFNTNNLTKFERQQLGIELHIMAESPSLDEANAVKYDMVTTEPQFLDMLQHLEASSDPIAFTARMESCLSLLQVLIAGRIFVVDVIDGEFSNGLWQKLSVVFANAPLLLGNTRSRDVVDYPEFWEFAEHSGRPSSKVVNMVAFYEFLKRHIRFSRVLKHYLRRRAPDMKSVMHEIQQRPVWTVAGYAQWEMRPLEPAHLNYAAQQVWMVWECYLTLARWFSNKKLKIGTAIEEFLNDETAKSSESAKNASIDFSTDLTDSEMDIVF